MNQEQYNISQQILQLQSEYAQLSVSAQYENDLTRLREMMSQRDALVRTVNELRLKLNETAS